MTVASVYYQDEFVTLHCGDNEAVLSALSTTFDLVFTSPPYNLGVNPNGWFGSNPENGRRGGNHKWRGVNSSGVDYGSHDDAMPWDAYVAWQQQVLTRLWGVLSDTGAVYYNHKPRVGVDGLWTPLELNPGLPVRQIVIWDRGSGLNFSPTNYVPAHEWIVVFAKPGFRLRDQSASGVGDVWRVPPDSGVKHPAPFPVGLPARAIETTGAAQVLDPFAGSGTTLVAAKAAGVHAVGIERSEQFCEIAVQRLRQHTLWEPPREQPPAPVPLPGFSHPNQSQELQEGR